MKKTIFAIIVALASVSAHAMDAEAEKFLDDVSTHSTSDPDVINEWNGLTYAQQQEVYAAKPWMRTELRAPAKPKPVVYTDDSRHPTNEQHTGADHTVHLDGLHNQYTMMPAITEKNNPAGHPTNQIAPATHLDGSKDTTVTPHLDAPRYDQAALEAFNRDRTASQHAEPTHLDGSNDTTVTPHLDAPPHDQEALEAFNHDRTASQHAEPTHLDGSNDTTVTPHLDAPPHDQAALEAFNRDRTASQHAEPTHLDGSNDTTVTPHLDAPPHDQAALEAFNRDRTASQHAEPTHLDDSHETPVYQMNVMYSDLLNHGSRISSNTARIDRNEQRIRRNEQDIQDMQTSVKRIGALAVASANLHYNRAENGYAVAVGEYAGSTAVAGGLQFNTSSNTAIDVQASYDGDDVGASVGFHGSY
ncbi:YadA C-terminal domain-containing protein [Neisseriaceae bacterium JH1-16]|nr:YadA C-terminal domain-containing protein [Neisseriaceae bacterium JH1-16]